MNEPMEPSELDVEQQFAQPTRPAVTDREAMDQARKVLMSILNEPDRDMRQRPDRRLQAHQAVEALHSRLAAPTGEVTDAQIDAIWEAMPEWTDGVHYRDQRKFAREVLAAAPTGEVRPAPLVEADVPFPPLPLPVHQHHALGHLYDRFAMHQYALRYADLVAARSLAAPLLDGDARLATDGKLAEELERLRQLHWSHWTAEENHVAATAVRVLRELNVWRAAVKEALGDAE